MDGTDRSEPSRIRRVPLTPDGYDQRWTDLAAAGAEVHGEADLVDGLVRELVASPQDRSSTPAAAPGGWRSNWPGAAT